VKHHRRLITGGLWAAWLIYAVAMFATLPLVPFHPDEATHLFLSSDFDTLVWQLNPAAVTWSAPDAPPNVSRYRLLEAPLSRYLIGLSRTLTGQHAQTVPVDWNWSADWSANAAAGALPSASLLTVARLPATIGTVLGALLVYAIAHRAGGLVAGLTAAALYAANGALWLHGRRAMSEGLTVGAMLFAMCVMMRWGRQALAVGAAVALTAAAKLTGVALLPAALVAVVWPFKANWRAALRPALVCLAAFALASLLLNPALWVPRTDTLNWVLRVRAELLTNQINTLRAADGPVVATPLQQTIALLVHLYQAPLQFWEVPNYAADTAAAEARYLAIPWHILFRAPSIGANFLSGLLFLILTLCGVLFSAFHAWRPSHTASPPDERRVLAVLGLSTLGVLAALYSIHIAWQRYYVPLLPLICIWAGLGAAALAQPLLRHFASRPRRGPVTASSSLT
jgi:4-amino-4-deoxy-L-arabinose transferase-like glycosyltransferase